MLRFAQSIRFNVLTRTPHLIYFREPRLQVFLSNLQPARDN